MKIIYIQISNIDIATTCVVRTALTLGVAIETVAIVTLLVTLGVVSKRLYHFYYTCILKFIKKIKLISEMCKPL